MAYVSQELKKELVASVKKVLPKNWKVTFGVRHHSTFVIKIHSAPIDLLENFDDYSKNKRYGQPNIYHLGHTYSGDLLKIFEKIKTAANIKNYDNSDIQTDYFDVGYYVDIRIGEFDKPFEVK